MSGVVSGRTFHRIIQVRRNRRLLDSFPCLWHVPTEIITLPVIDGRRLIIFGSLLVGRTTLPPPLCFSWVIFLFFLFLSLSPRQDKIELSEMEIIRLRWNRIATEAELFPWPGPAPPSLILGKHCWWGWTMKWLAAVCWSARSMEPCGWWIGAVQTALCPPLFFGPSTTSSSSWSLILLFVSLSLSFSRSLRVFSFFGQACFLASPSSLFSISFTFAIISILSSIIIPPENVRGYVPTSLSPFAVSRLLLL